MSLAEFPLYFVLLPDVEVGLDRNDRRGDIFPVKRGFFLDIHIQRETDVEEVERGERASLGVTPLFRDELIPRELCKPISPRTPITGGDALYGTRKLAYTVSPL